MDLLTKDGVHKGGTITPGWTMMRNSLVENTNGITLNENEISEFLGVSTQQGIQAGISAACVGAIEYIVRRYQSKLSSALSCVVTGGSAPMLLQKLLESDVPAAFKHEPNWVLMGLAVISGNPIENSYNNGMG